MLQQQLDQQRNIIEKSNTDRASGSDQVSKLEADVSRLTHELTQAQRTITDRDATIADLRSNYKSQLATTEQGLRNAEKRIEELTAELSRVNTLGGSTDGSVSKAEFDAYQTDVSRRIAQLATKSESALQKLQQEQ